MRTKSYFKATKIRLTLIKSCIEMCCLYKNVQRKLKNYD